VGELDNAHRPAVVTQFGCWNTFYVSPEEDSLAQRFLLEGDHGAVVVMGTTSLSRARTERVFGDLLYRNLSRGMRIGDAVQSARRSLAEVDPEAYDVLLGWTVLGPADLTVE
jgi:hypothetical protein